MTSGTQRTAAVKTGATHYQGAPCKRGHPGIRYVRSGACVDCARSPLYRGNWQGSERQKAYKRAIRKANPQTRRLEAQRRAARTAPERAKRRAERLLRVEARKRMIARIARLADALASAVIVLERDTSQVKKARMTREMRSALARQRKETHKASKPQAYRESARRKRATRASRERAAGRMPSKEERYAMLERQAFKCAYCGDHEQLELDHKIPVVDGGTNALTNLQYLCQLCNNLKRRTWDSDYRAANGIPDPYAL